MGSRFKATHETLQENLRELPTCFRFAYTVKILLNARAFIINNAFSIERDGHLLESTLAMF